MSIYDISKWDIMDVYNKFFTICRQIIVELIDTEKDYVKKLGHVKMVSVMD